MLPQSEAGRLATYTGARLLWRWCIFGLLPGLCFGGAVAPTGSPAVAPSESPAIAPSGSPALAPTAVPAPSGSPALAPTAVPAPTPLPTTFNYTKCAYPNDWRALSALYHSTFDASTKWTLWSYGWGSENCPESSAVTYINTVDSHVTGIYDASAGAVVSGTLPTQVGYLTELTGGFYGPLVLWGSASNDDNGNSLTGTIPTEFGRLTGLSALEMGTNALTQTLPTELGQLTDLTSFDFDGNSLDCGIPTELSALGSADANNDDADANEAYFGASTCETVNALSALYHQMFTSQDGSWGNWLATGYNNPCSSESDAWSNVDSNDNTLFDCNLLGSSTGGYYVEVNNVGLSNIQSGSLPTELGGLTALTYVQAYEQNLQSTLPTELGRLTASTSLSIYDNYFNGALPTELGRSTLLTSFDISSNYLTGSIPSELGNLDAVEFFQLHDNGDDDGGTMSGALPTELGMLTSTQGLLLGGSGHVFECGVPTEISGLAYSSSFSSTYYWPGTSSCEQNSALSALYDNGASNTGPPFTIQSSNWGYGTNLCNLVVDSNGNEVVYAGSTTGWYGMDCSLVFDQDTSLATYEIVGISSTASWDAAVSGTLPTEFGYLTAFTSSLDLSVTAFSGSLPTEFGRLTSMTGMLDLESVSEIQGSLPTELAQMDNLEGLRISSTKASGSIPTQVGNFSSLCYGLLLGSNGFTGQIPTEVGAMTCLSDAGLDLSENSLTGSIPSHLGNLKVVQSTLNLASNQLTNTVPTQLGGLTEITSTFDLSAQALSGSIPTQFGGLTSLTTGFNIDNNDLEGTLPTEIFRLSVLESGLKLNDNNLDSTIPTEVSGLAALTSSFYLATNSFTGKVPTELGQLTFADEFHLSSNAITSSVPTELGNFDMTASFYVDSNSISGHIPTELGRWSLFQSKFEVFSNQLDGSIASQLGLWTALTSGFKFYTNTVIGKVPTQLGKMSVMQQDFDLSVNSLTGWVPTQLGYFTGMSEGFYLSTNQFSGKLPTQFGAMSTFDNRFYLSGNDIGSSLPTEFGHMSSLQELLSFDSNSFCADLPSEIAVLPARFVTAVSTSVGTPCDACDVGEYYFTDTSARDPVTNEYVTSCPKCPAGKYQDDSFFGGSSCTKCEVGKYSEEGASSCTVCSAGRHTRGREGAANCTACSTGTFLSDAGTSAALHRNASQCSNCAAGTAASTEGSASCSDCASGKAMATTGATSCSDCTPGKYIAATGASECIDCGTTTYSGRGALACKPCVGNTEALAGSAWCDLCKVNYIRDDRPWKFMEKTTSATYNYKIKPYHNTSCIPCDDYDVYSTNDDETAFLCENATITAGAEFEIGATLIELKVQPGWWRPTQYTFKDNKNDGMRKCPLKNACRGGRVFADGGNSYCNRGYEGPMCSLCWPKTHTFDEQTGECIECEGADGGLNFTNPALLLMFVIFFLVLVLLARYVRRKLKKANLSCTDAFGKMLEAAEKGDEAMDEAVEAYAHKDDGDGDGDGEPHEENWKVRLLRLKKSLSVKGKIIMTFIQIASTAGSNLGRLEFPDNFTAFTKSLNFVNLNVLSVVPFGCIDAGTNFYTTLVFMTMVPIILFVFFLVLNKTTGKNVFFSAALTLCFFVLPSSSTTILQALKCEPFEDIDSAYLEADYSVVCWENGSGFESMPTERKFFIFYAVIMIFIFPVGIPALFAVNLHKHRYSLCPPMRPVGEEPTEGLRAKNFENQGWQYIFFHSEMWDHFTLDDISDEDKEKAAHLTFLTNAYEPQMYWFEVFECIRRLMLSSMLIMINPGTAAQIVVAILVCLLGIKFYSYYNPFVEDSDDHMAEAAQWQTFCVFFAALLLRVDHAGDSPESQMLLGVFLIIIVSTGFVIMGTMIFVELWIEYSDHQAEVAAYEAERRGDVVDVVELDTVELKTSGTGETAPLDEGSGSARGAAEAEEQTFFSVIAESFESAFGTFTEGGASGAAESSANASPLDPSMSRSLSAPPVTI